MHGNVSEWCRDWHHQDAWRRLDPQNPVWLESPGDDASARVDPGGHAPQHGATTTSQIQFIQLDSELSASPAP